MPAPYDTPPDGDFVRYVEQLGRPAPGGGAEPAARAQDRPRGRPPRSPAPSSMRPPGPFAPLRQALQWALLVYVLYLMGVAAFPPLAAWGRPIALAFLVFVFLRLRRLPWRDLLKNQ